MDSIVYQIEESNLGNNHEAYCPELLITGFGDTAEKARKALRREIGIYLEDCEGLGILDEVLIEALSPLPEFSIGLMDNEEALRTQLSQ